MAGRGSTSLPAAFLEVAMMKAREKAVARKVELDRTDVATFLSGLTSRLRNNALALTGLAWRHSHPGNADHEDLHDLAGSLERTAALLAAAKDRLCQKCKLQGVAVQVTFGNPDHPSL